MKDDFEFMARINCDLEARKAACKARDILRVGCGPAIIEAGLAEHGFNVTGLDISGEALGRALESVRTVAGSAENVGFPDSSFDAVIYVASLQFIERYKEAIKQTVRVLRAGGKLLIMLLNLESDFFKERTRNPASYINKIRHTDLSEIERAVAEHLPIETEYFLGIKGTRIFQSGDPNVASLYVINGTCETRGEIHEWPDRPDFSRQALDVSCVRVHITVCCVRCERGIYSDNALGRRRYGD